MNGETISRPRALERVILLLIAFAAMLLIAFLDEGRNSFSWMKDTGNWITIGFFTLIIFGGQMLSWRVLGESIDRVWRGFFAAMGGFVLFGLFMVVYGIVIMAVR